MLYQMGVFDSDLIIYPQFNIEKNNLMLYYTMLLILSIPIFFLSFSLILRFQLLVLPLFYSLSSYLWNQSCFYIGYYNHLYNFYMITFLNLLRVPLLRSLMYLPIYHSMFSCEKGWSRKSSIYLEYIQTELSHYPRKFTSWPGHSLGTGQEQQRGDSVWMILLMQCSNILISQSSSQTSLWGFAYTKHCVHWVTFTYIIVV